MVGIRTDVQDTAQMTGPWKHVQISHYTVIKVLSYSSLSVELSVEKTRVKIVSWGMWVPTAIFMYMWLCIQLMYYVYA